MNPIDLLDENAPLRVLREAETYLESRKVSNQQVGTYNVRTGAYGPLTVTYNLTTASPQSLSTGVAFDQLTFTPYFMNDAFCRVVTKLTVGGSWYRPSNKLADIKNSITPYDVQVYRKIVDATQPRNQRQYQIVLSGPINGSVTMDLWIVSIGTDTV